MTDIAKSSNEPHHPPIMEAFMAGHRTAQPDADPAVVEKAAESYWIGEARISAAQCWCDDETQHIPMDAVLAEAVARRIAAWMSEAARYASNADYWRVRAQAIPEDIQRVLRMAATATTNEERTLAKLAAQEALRAA